MIAQLDAKEEVKRRLAERLDEAVAVVEKELMDRETKRWVSNLRRLLTRWLG